MEPSSPRPLAGKWAAHQLPSPACGRAAGGEGTLLDTTPTTVGLVTPALTFRIVVSPARCQAVNTQIAATTNITLGTSSHFALGFRNIAMNVATRLATVQR